MDSTQEQTAPDSPRAKRITEETPIKRFEKLIKAGKLGYALAVALGVTYGVTRDTGDATVKGAHEEYRKYIDSTQQYSEENRIAIKVLEARVEKDIAHLSEMMNIRVKELTELLRQATASHAAERRQLQEQLTIKLEEANARLIEERQARTEAGAKLKSLTTSLQNKTHSQQHDAASIERLSPPPESFESLMQKE